MGGWGGVRTMQAGWVQVPALLMQSSNSTRSRTHVLLCWCACPALQGLV